MALISTPRRRFGVALGVVLTGVAAGLVGFAGPASAHTKDVSAKCEKDATVLRVNLEAYATHRTNQNHVKITDGDKVLVDKDFQRDYRKEFKTTNTEAHIFKVQVTAWDDPKYSFKKEYPVAACVTPPPTTTVPPTTTTTVPPVTTTTTTVPPTTTTTVPPVTTTTTITTTVPPTTTTTSARPVTTTTAKVEEAALAETGASIGVPLGIGGVLLVGGGVLLFVVRRRSKA